ncbi:Wzt carbohydrate-binding domain-containing protein [Bradyrhizobium septentrionale]|uniref:Wzt carbohydrate-binding domain-containing protein n=1 Tax=Bradyrhizobium septentrionale TaxID=1404411 RepID=UPI0030D344B7
MMGLNDSKPKETVPSSLPQHVTETAEFTVFRLRHLGEPVFQVGEDLTFEFAVRGKVDMPGLVFGLSIYRRDGQWIIGQTSHECKAVWPARPRGATAQGAIVLKGLVLGPGEYIACLACYNEDFTICHAMTELIVSFAVKLPYPTWGGIIHPIEWHDSSESL